MENNIMSWSKRTQSLWKAFEDAVLCRDKKQFEIFVEFRKSQLMDKQNQEENELAY